MNTRLTQIQRIGLAVAGMLQGQVVAALLLTLAIALRNIAQYKLLAHNVLWVLRYIVVPSLAFEAMAATLTWFLTVVPLVVGWTPQRIRSLGWWLLPFYLAVGALSVGVLWVAMWLQLRKVHAVPQMPPVATIVTIAYGAVVTGVGMWRYFRFTAEAAKQLARHARG